MAKKITKPTKLTENLIKAFEEVLNDGFNTIILSDEDLVFEINERLEEKEKVSEIAVRKWKQSVKKGERLDEIGKRFYHLIKKALIKQKKELFEKFKQGKAGEWQKWAWIIERKFEEWNIRQKFEHKTVSLNFPEVA